MVEPDTRPAIIRSVERWNRALNTGQTAATWCATATVEHRPPAAGFHDRARTGAAAGRAHDVYPGPVGELIHREIQAFLGFGDHVRSRGAPHRPASNCDIRLVLGRREARHRPVTGR